MYKILFLYKYFFLLYNQIMCGISGILSLNNSVKVIEFLLASIALLMNRGYDSIGIATIGDSLEVTKYASCNSYNLLEKIS